MKKGDIMIISAVLALALIIGVFYSFSKGNGTIVKISKNNTVLYSVSIKEDREINLDTNIVKIENGSVRVTNASCKNQICVNHKPIKKKGEVIACLPNKVLVEIE